MLAIASGPAAAHPHVWVTVKSELVYAPDGTLTGVRHAWTFDDMFSTFATQGLEAKKKGEFTREELAPLAEVNVTSLKEYDFFTNATANGQKVEFNEPLEGYYLVFDPKETELTLHFTLPLKAPVKTKDVNIEVFDREYFVDFSFAEKDPVKLVGAPAQCKLSIGKPQEMGAALSQRLSQLGPNQRDPSLTIGSEFANKIFGDMSVNSATGGRLLLHLAIAVAAVAGILLIAGALETALAQAGPFGVGTPRAQSAPPQSSGVIGWILPSRRNSTAVLRPDPRRQDRRQRGLEPVRAVVSLWRLSRRRSRPRQGGDLVLHDRQ